MPSLPTFGAVDMLLGEEAEVQTKYSHICCGRVNIVPMAIIVATIQLIFNVASIAGYSYALAQGLETYEDSNPIFATAVAYESMPTMLALNLLWLVFLMALFYGVREAYPLFVIPQTVVQFVGVCMAVYLFFGNLYAVIANKDDGTKGLSVAVLILMAVLLGFQLFCLIVMVRCYRFLKNQRRRLAEMNGWPGARPASVPAWQVAKKPESRSGSVAAEAD